MSDPLDDLILKASADETKAGQIRASMAFGMMQNPDERAKAQRVAKQLDTTPQAAHENLSNFEKAANRNTFDFDGFIKHTPKLATWSANPENAAVAHDDMDSLKELEHATQDRPKGVTDSQWQALLSDRIRVWQENKGKNETQSGIQSFLNRSFGLGTSVASWASAPLSMVQQLGGMANKIVSGQGIDQTLREGPGDVFGDTISGGLKRLGEAQAQAMGQQYVKTGPQRMLVDPVTGKSFINPDSNEIFNRDLLNTVEGMPADLISMWMTGGMAGGKIFPAYMAADAMENKAKAAEAYRAANGLPANSIRDYAEGSVSGALNWFLMTGMPHAVPTRTLLGDALQKTARAAVLGPSLNASENALAGAHGEQKPLTEGALKSFVHFLPWELQSTLPRLIQAASTSKLKGRSPEAFQKATESILKDSGVEQVMIPADRLTTFFQAQGLDPIREADRLGAKNYAEAVAAGTDVVIPTADFLAKLKPEDHQALLPDLRTQVGGLTAREAEAYQAEASKVDLKAQVEPVDKTAYQTIYEDMLAQLHDVGHSGKYAEDQADLHARVMVNIAKDFGKDPIALSQERGLRIYRPAPSEGGNPVDISLGRMGRGDALAAQDFNLDPAMDPRYWQTAVDAEVQKSAPNLETPEFKSWFGGSQAVDEFGKPKVFYHGTMDEFSQFKPSDRGIFFSEKPDFASFFGRGNDGRMIPAYLKVEHPFDYQNPKDLEAYRAWKGRDAAPDAVAKGEFDVLESPDFQKFLKESGYDGFYVEENGVRNLAVFDPTQIKSALTNTGAFDPKSPEIYFQPAYHGSPFRFDKFTLDHIGKGEGAQAYGWGLYFAGNKQVAEYYRKSLSNSSDMASYTWNGKRYEARSGPEAHALALAFHESIATAKKIAKGGLADVEKGDPYALEMGKEYWQKMLDTANAIKSKREVKQDTGQVYKVDIPEDGKYLLWDKPLSEQPEAVKNWVNSLPHEETTGGTKIKFPNGESLYASTDPNGSVLYSMLAEANPVNGQEVASKTLNEIGIPGIKYEDGNTRNVNLPTDKKFYNYVIFDANAVNTLETYYQSAKRNPQDYQRLRTRLASLRSLSPSHQSGELTRRALEAKAANDEFLKWEADVKATQAGDIFADKRGFIQFSPDHKTSIALLEKANFTTLTHELGHEYLSLLGRLADEPGAAGVGVESYKSVLKFLGVEDSSQITTAHHEKFADAAIGYFLEGKAPTPELRGTFQRMKYWMMTAYQNLQALGVKLSPEIRGVFDRLFAGEAAVEEASKVVDLKPMFTTAEDMNTTPAVFDVYAKLSEKARATANDAVESKLMREFQREKEAWWKDETAKVAEEVTGEVNAEPIYQAFKALTDGKLEDGTPIKINKDALEAQFGEGIGKELPRSKGWLYTREGGMDAEAAAEILGFNSGDELIQALKTMEPRKERIARLTDERMKATHGDMMTDGTLAETAIEAIHNQAREEMKMAELRELRRMQRTIDPALKAAAKEDKAQAKEAMAVPPRKAFAEAAREIVDGTSPRDLQPYRYLQASERLGKESDAAFLKKDYQAAGDAKQKEILNHHLFLEATKAREEALDIFEYGREGQTPKFQGKLGKAGQEYRGQWNALASRYEFRKVPNFELDQRAKSLSDWVAANVEDGAEIDPSILIEGPPKNWREVPMAELRAVQDALKNIETVAKHQLGATLEGRNLDLAREAMELGSVARANNGYTPTPRRGVKMGVIENQGSRLQGLNAYMSKVEWFVDKLDGGDINGPARRNIKKPIDDASGRKKQMTEDIKGKLLDVFKDMTREERAKEFDSTGVQFPSMDRPMNRLQLISWALNLGTEENRKVAILGEGLMEGDGSLKPEFDKALGALTAKEATRIQGIWDALESMRPAIIAKELREKGFEPKWKKLTPFTIHTSDGQAIEMKGGYYPLKADPDATNIGRRQEVPLGSEGAFTRPGVSESHTKEVTGATYPLLLDYTSVLGKHVPAVINNVTMGEAISYVSKFIMREDVSTTMKETIGLAREKEFLPWLQSVASDGVDTSNSGPIMSFLMRRRLGMAIARLGGNVTSYLVQGGDSFKLIAAGESPDYLMKLFPQAVIDIRMNPKETIEEIRRLSPNEMRFREANGNREVRDILNNRSPIEENKQRAAEFVMSGFMVMDRIQTFPAWLAKFREGMAKHGVEDQAVAEADRLIARAFQAGEPRNLSRMMRGNEGMKLITSFQGDANTWYGILSRAFESKDVGLVSVALLSLIAEQMVAASIRQGLPKKDDLGKWSIEQMIAAFLNPFGPFGDFAQYGVSKFEGKYATQTNPTMDAISKMFALPAAVKNYATGKKDGEALAIETLDAVGMWNGIPLTGQIVKSWKYQHNVRTGKQPKAPNPASEAWRTLTGPPAKENQ